MTDDRRDWPGDAISTWLRSTCAWNRRGIRVALALVVACLGLGFVGWWHYQPQAPLWLPARPALDSEWIASERVIVNLSGLHPVIDLDRATANMIAPLARRPGTRGLWGRTLAAANGRGDLAIASNLATQSSGSATIVTTSVRGQLAQHRVNHVGWFGGLVGIGGRWELYTPGHLDIITKPKVSHRALPTVSTKGETLGVFWRDRWFVIDAEIVEEPEFRAVFEAVDVEGARYHLATVHATSAPVTKHPRRSLLGALAFQGNIEAGETWGVFAIEADRLIVDKSFLDEYLGHGTYELDLGDWVVARDRPRRPQRRCREIQKLIEPARVRSVAQCSCRDSSSSRCPRQLWIEGDTTPAVSVFPTIGGHVYVTENATRLISDDAGDRPILTPSGRIVLINKELTRLRLYDQHLELISDRRISLSADARLELLRSDEAPRR